MSRVIEAKAVISGRDDLSKVLDGLNRKMRDIGKGMKVSADVDRLNRSLADAKRGLEAIDRLRERQAGFAGARTRHRADQEQVARIASELAAARKAAAEFDGIRSFSKGSAIAKEIEGARRKVADLEAGLRTAQRSVKGSAAAFEAQAGAIKEAKAAAEAAGVSIAKLGAEERRLKANVEASTFAIEKREAHARNFGPGGPLAEGVSRTFPRGAARGHGDAGGIGDIPGAAMLGRFGAGALGGVGGAVGAGLALRKAADSSISFERSMIEVGKATDASGADLDAYGEKVLALSRATGKTKEDLASMLSAAGFAGRPKHELMDFTEYAAKATVAWQTSADETGQALAEIGNIYEANQKRIEGIGDAINTMADNSASKETDLLEFMRRAGASSRQAGISAEHMLAFGAALKEVGVRNEVAATGFEALLNVMKLGSEFSKKAGEGLKGLGVDSTTMRKAFVAKPIETTIDLLEKLNNVADPLKKAEIMTNLFGKEYQDDIAKLLNALPKLKQYIGLMSDAQKLSAGGVRLQFAQNLDKDVSKIDRAARSIDVLLKRAGDPIKERLGAAAEALNQVVDRVETSMNVFQRWKAQRDAYRREMGLPEEKPLQPESREGNDAMAPVRRAHLDFQDWLYGREGKYEDDLAQALKGGRERAERERAEADAKILAGPKEVEAKIARRQAALDRAREVEAGPPGIQRDMAGQQVTASTAEIARLRGELDKAWEAVGGLRERQRQERGAFGLDGPAGKPVMSIGPGRFGFGLNGTDALPPRTVPLPPRRPDGLGGASPGPEAGVRTVPVEVVSLPDKASADAARGDAGGSAKQLPGGADPGKGFPTEITRPRGFWSGLFGAPERTQQQLPGFGTGTKTIPVEVRSLPPDARLGEASGAGGKPPVPDGRLEVKLAPDQVVAKVESLPEVTGTVTETIRHEHHHTISLNSDILDARIRSVAQQTVKSIPLASSGARPGAISMPGAAQTPGAK